jgi:CheY-like chemotaxis protein
MEREADIVLSDVQMPEMNGLEWSGHPPSSPRCR